MLQASKKRANFKLREMDSSVGNNYIFDKIQGTLMQKCIPKLVQAAALINGHLIVMGVCVSASKILI